MSNDPIKDALQMMPYGFYSITSREGDAVNAMVANWIMQVSFEPRLVAMAIQKKSYSFGLIQKEGVFAVNIFNKQDAEVLKLFTKGRAKNPEKMKGVNFTPGPQTGCPILEGAAAYLECEVIAIHDDGGDHNLVVGKVINADVFKPGDANETLTLPDLGWSYAG